MEKFISIEDIENSKNGSLTVNFNDMIEGIDSVGSVKASLNFLNLGEFIEVIGNVKLIINLECDICLKKFTQKMDFEIREIFAKGSLQEEYGQETEIKDGQFVTDLNGEDEIDICDLLYQSVILNLPNKKVCGINCNGKEFFQEENLSDPRLAIFKNIKIEKKS